MAPLDKNQSRPEDAPLMTLAAPPEDTGKTLIQRDAKSERSELAADQTEASAAASREELRDEVYVFNDEEKLKYKKAFDKDLEARALASMTIDELSAAETKEPGITKILFKKIQEDKKEKFTAHNNHDVEWQKGLKDLVDENDAEITLYIHPKNLTKAANKNFLENNQKAKESYAAYQETPPRIIFFERKSTKREGGSFFNDDGYLRIFDGDTWTIDKTLTDEELAGAKRAELARAEQLAAERQVDESRPGETQPEDAAAPAIRYAEPTTGNEAPINVSKPKTIDSALETYGDVYMSECEKQGVPIKLMKFMYALSRAESKWSMHADNPTSSAYGVGQLLNSTTKMMYKGLIKSGRTDIPQDTGEFMRMVKTDARLQIATFVRLVKSSANSMAQKLPGHDPLRNPDEISMAFMAIAHHDGQGGVNGYIRWWKAKGSPDRIPKFPDKDTALQYLKAGFQKKRGMDGREGTNGLIGWAYDIAKNADSYEAKVANFIQQRNESARNRAARSDSNST